MNIPEETGERTFHLTFHEDRNNRGAGVRYFRTIFVMMVVVVSLLSFSSPFSPISISSSFLRCDANFARFK